MKSTGVLGCVAGWLLLGCGGDTSSRPDDVAEWSLTPVTVVQPEQAPFGRVADLELGDDGTLFVLDGLSRTIRVFDRDGAEVREFGGRGQGPGEFEQPGRLAWGPDGDLWVLDLRNGRLTAFGPEGELRSTHRPSDLPILFPFALSFSGPNRVQWVGVSSPDPARPAAAWVETELADGAFTPLDHNALPLVEWPLLFEDRDDETALVLPVPFSGEPLFGFDPLGRLWYNYSGDAVLYRWSTSGDVEFTLSTDPAPTPVTDSDREAALAREELAEVRDRLGDVAVSEMASLIPANKPYYGAFFFDDVGSLWVMHAGASASHPETRRVDVYSMDGVPRATASTALAPVPRPRARDGLVAGVIRDSLGVESIGVFRVLR
ncbi:MAG: 6-bladed beta-propeller [Phycisphaerales bacterium JB038]